MAKIILENTREHEVSISGMDENGDLVQVTVPAARQHPTEQGEFINGVTEADDAFVNAIVKKSKAVAHYFEEGWLVVVKSAAADKKSAAAKQESKQE
jgi:hypothetical protein